MVEIDLNSVGHDKRFTLDDSVMAVFVTGSYVNGYFHEDSDIDVVVVSDSDTKPIENVGSKVSVHHIGRTLLEYYEKARHYCVLHNVSLINPEYVSEVSLRTKRETVMREAKKLQKLHERKGLNGKIAFEPIDLLFRYFTREWGVIEPWRMKPLRRIMASEESPEILEDAYSPVFKKLITDGFLVQDGDRYSISPTAVLNDDAHQVSSCLGKFLYHFRESRGGIVYLQNAVSICKNIKALNSL